MQQPIQDPWVGFFLDKISASLEYNYAALSLDAEVMLKRSYVEMRISES